MSDPIGVLGLGLIGSVVADRLLQGGYEVAGYDPSVAMLEGVEMKADANAIFARCETVLLCLPDGHVVRAVMEETRATLRKEHLIINTSTGDAETPHAQMIEATIGGSSAMLRDGGALLFLGGDSTLIDRAQPILKALSSQRFHLGEFGAGARFKLVHNMAIGLNRAVVAETLQFAEALGFDTNQALEILLQSPASSTAMKAKGAKMVTGNYEPPQARLTQHLKDVRLMLAAAQEASMNVPLTELHEKLLSLAESRGFGEVDNAAIIEAYRKEV